MTTRQKNLAILLAIGILAATGFVFSQRAVESASALSAVPRDSFLVAVLDVPALRASPLGGYLASAEKGEVLGFRAISETCGVDATSFIKEVVIAVPEEGDSGDFGVALTGDVKRDDFVACIEKVMRARGKLPRVTKRGSFALIEDAAVTDGKAHSKLAFRDGGLAILASGSWLDKMIDTAEGRAPNIRTNPAHDELRTALGRDRSVVMTATLPQALRERLKREMGAEIAAQPDGTQSTTAMAGVLAVYAVGIAVSTRSAGVPSEAVAELRCENEKACSEVRKLIERKRLTLSKDIRVRLIGLGPLIDGMTFDERGTHLKVTTQAPTDDLVKIVDRILEARMPSSPAPAILSAMPDEVIAPEERHDGGRVRDASQSRD